MDLQNEYEQLINIKARRMADKIHDLRLDRQHTHDYLAEILREYTLPITIFGRIFATFNEASSWMQEAVKRA